MMRVANLFHRRGIGVAVAVLSAALAPPLGVTLWQGEPATLVVFALALGVALFWDVAFSSLRRRPFAPHGLTTAAIFTLFAPPDLPLWHLVVVLSLGVVIGEKVFGGRGFAFLSPAAVALALALLSLPDLTLAASSREVALACLPGLVLLLASGLLSAHMAVTFCGVLLLAQGIVAPPDLTPFLLALLPALVFLIGDPTTGAVTNLGRVLHGALAAAIVLVFNGSGGPGPAPDALVFAALFASLFAPLMDHLAVTVHSVLRARRLG